MRLFFIVVFLLSSVQAVTFFELVQQLQNQLHFDYILTVDAGGTTFPQLIWQLPKPTIQLQTEANRSYHLDAQHSGQLLSIVFVEEPAEKSLAFLSLNLRIWNTQPVLLVLQRHMAVAGILSWCWHRHQLLNVLAVTEDFEHSCLIYSFRPFPTFQLEQRCFGNTSNEIWLFQPRLHNLQGYQLPMLVGGSPPRLIVYRNPRGELVFKGVVGHLMHCFERRYNCRLMQHQPINESVVVPAQQLIAALGKGMGQFALAATHAYPPVDRYTYPFELMDWCLMLPVPGLVPPAELYTRVLDVSTFLMVLLALMMISALLSLSLRRYGHHVQPHEFLLHQSCLRGALGQSFSELERAPRLVRGIYLEICVLGFLLTAWYNSYFSAYITSGPREKPFENYQQILKSHLRIVIWTPEYQMMLTYKPEMDEFRTMFKHEANFEEFLKVRDSFNDRYGYVMPLEKWNFISQQQKVFSSPLFSFREDLCIYRGVPVAFAIVPNSVFREPLERLIGEVAATGLMTHWRDMAFNEMITAGKLTLADLGKPNQFRPMQLQDLHHILIAGGVMLGLALVVFLLELLVFWLGKI